MKKTALRQEIRSDLTKIADTVETKSRLIRDRLMTMVVFRHALQSERLMSFVSMPLEADTTPFFAEHSMIVPCCEAEEIVPMRILSLDELEPTSRINILEPKVSIRQDVSRRVPLEQIDVVLVPGLAFDRFGNRLGRGKGYYDRFLRRLSAEVLTIGLAFDGTIRDQIPCDENDCPVNVVVTDSNLFAA